MAHIKVAFTDEAQSKELARLERDTRRRGIEALIHLQAVAGWKESPGHAAKCWDSMDTVLKMKTILVADFMRALDPENAAKLAHTVSRIIAKHQLNMATKTAGRG